VVDVTELESALDQHTLDELRDSVGGDAEFLAELVEEFVADAPTQIASLRAAATTGDAAVAGRAAHTLKGMSRTFGAAALAALCQEAETAAGSDDLASVLARVGSIDAEWARVRSELLALTDGRG
jgi:HPt (histidine-containing phosphotransfer) domain-containing protein